jgi:hypothetical protein
MTASVAVSNSDRLVICTTSRRVPASGDCMPSPPADSRSDSGPAAIDIEPALVDKRPVQAGNAPPNVIRRAAEIDADWLQDVLRGAGIDAPPIRRVSNLAFGRGTMGATVRSVIAYEGPAAGAPPSVVCKLSSPFEPADRVARDAGVYTREVNAYRLFGSAPLHRVPRAYLAQTAADGSDINLVLEDLTDWEAGDQVAGCSVPQARALVSELARLHREFWRREDVLDLPWLLRRRDKVARYVELYARGVARVRETWGERMTAADLEIAEGFAKLAPTWFAHAWKRTVLIHGDPRLDNVLFDMSAPARPKACLIDWQALSLGDPQNDLGYFLTGALEPEVRRGCEGELIAEHAAEIGAVDPSYTLEEARRSHRLNVVSGLIGTVCAALTVPPSPHNDVLMLTLLARNAQAVRDWDGLRAIAGGLE